MNTPDKINADNWRAECANYRGIGARAAVPVDPAICALRMTWVNADLAPKVKTAPDKSRTLQVLGPDARAVTFVADGVREVLTPEDAYYVPSGNVLDLGPVTATCLQRRLTQRGAVYVWQIVPGGRFDRFETLGLPAGIQEVKRK